MSIYIQFRLGTSANFHAKNRSLTLFDQFACTFVNQTHRATFKRCFIGAIPRIPAIIKIIIHLFVSAGKGVTGNVKTMILKLIRSHIQTGINRCLDKCFPQVLFIHNCVHHSLAIVGGSVVHVGERLIMCQGGICHNRLVRHKFYFLSGHDMLVPRSRIFLMIRAFDFVFNLFLFHELD